MNRPSGPRGEEEVAALRSRGDLPLERTPVLGVRHGLAIELAWRRLRACETSACIEHGVDWTGERPAMTERPSRRNV